MAQAAVKEKAKAPKVSAAVAKKPKAEAKEKAKPAAEKKAAEKAPVKEFVAKYTAEKTPSGIELNEVIVYPLISEKAVGAIEAQNKITFIVNKKATKTDVRKAIEQLYSVKVDSVRTLRDLHGRKKAIVRLGKEFKAQELATKLGVV